MVQGLPLSEYKQVPGGSQTSHLFWIERFLFYWFKVPSWKKGRLLAEYGQVPGGSLILHIFSEQEIIYPKFAYFFASVGTY